MSYKIINNLSPRSHGELIKSILLKSDEVIIASPYLFSDFSSFLDEIKWRGTNKLQLITTLKQNSEEQFKKINSLKNLIDYAKIIGVQVKISIDNSLHGKIYIFKSKNAWSSAIVSSANFTHNGFYGSREWGIQIFDAHETEQLYLQVVKNIEFDEVDHYDIQKMYKEAKAYTKQHGGPKPKEISLKLIDLISTGPFPALGNGLNYFLKPIGHSDNHVKQTDSYHHPVQPLHFAKKEPKDIKIGDIFVAFAVGSGKILSVYRMVSPLEYTVSTDRWPWYIRAANITASFGKNWWKNNLTKEGLKTGFDVLHPGKGIKPKNHNQNFGAFQWGRDRMKITEEFGKYIITEALKH